MSNPMPGNADNFIASTVVTEKTPVVAGIDALMNKIIGAVDALGEKFNDYVRNMEPRSAVDFAPGDHGMAKESVSPEAPMVARSQQIEAPEKTPMISKEILASAKNATIGMSSGFQVAEVESHNFSPIGINAQGPAMGGGIGMA